MIIVHFRDGTTSEVDPRRDPISTLDSYQIQKTISRVSIVGNNGVRVDLPRLNGSSRVWIEMRKNRSELKGETIYIRKKKELMSATLYYSDNRVVVDIDD